jgi:putative copper export protein/mono/diheme cytochrome c family protein
LPLACARGLKRRFLWLAQASVAVSLLGSLAWLVVQAAAMADAESAAEALEAVPTVLLKTSFGHVIAAQLAAMLALALALGWRDTTTRQRASLGVATLAVALQAGHSHASAMIQGPSLLLGFDMLHLLGAGAWLGGLLPLLLLVHGAPPKAGAVAARWFSPLGQWCIAALIVSAAFQAYVLVASIAGLVGTAYGWMIMVKLALFAVLLGFAAINRYRYAPALLRGEPEAARRVLLRSIAAQTGFALAIIVAAVVLSELPPAMHLQPYWPFAHRIALDGVRNNPPFLRELVFASLSLACALALLTAALLMRRLRLAAAGVAALVAWFAVPHFGVLLAAAYPTSFYRSPTGFSSESIVAGSALYGTYCTSCHGAGDLGMHEDGELFWWISHGMAPSMPGFAAVLDDDQRWALIDDIRARNAGNSMRETGRWPYPVQAPGLAARCASRTVQLADLRGQYVRLVIGPVTAPPAADPGVTTIATATSPAPAGVCVARDESVAAAYAIVSGMTQEAVAGTQFLIDGNGWLRAMQRPGNAAGWNDAASLAAEIRRLRAQPVSSPAGKDDMMNMPM